MAIVFWTTLKNYYFPSLFPQILTTMSFDISTIIMEIAGLSLSAWELRHRRLSGEP